MAKGSDSGGEMGGKPKNGLRERSTPPQTKAEEKEARLASELRRNLLKRKKQTRAREGVKDPGGDT